MRAFLRSVTAELRAAGLTLLQRHGAHHPVELTGVHLLLAVRAGVAPHALQRRAAVGALEHPRRVRRAGLHRRGARERPLLGHVVALLGAARGDLGVVGLEAEAHAHGIAVRLQVRGIQVLHGAHHHCLHLRGLAEAAQRLPCALGEVRGQRVHPAAASRLVGLGVQRVEEVLEGHQREIRIERHRPAVRSGRAHRAQALQRHPRRDRALLGRRLPPVLMGPVRRAPVAALLLLLLLHGDDHAEEDHHQHHRAAEAGDVISGGAVVGVAPRGAGGAGAGGAAAAGGTGAGVAVAAGGSRAGVAVAAGGTRAGGAPAAGGAPVGTPSARPCFAPRSDEHQRQQQQRAESQTS